ncbi:MAG TPA: hypothetical protein VGY48_03180, partial [Vicinamibacterales bacterium]|nr:hypothetical protein [Vicinamibacterales bacterium]
MIAGPDEFGDRARVSRPSTGGVTQAAAAASRRGRIPAAEYVETRKCRRRRGLFGRSNPRARNEVVRPGFARHEIGR